MLYGFKHGAAEAIRMAGRHMHENGLGHLNCVDAQVGDQPFGSYRTKGVIRWTVRFDGFPLGPFDDGSIILAVDLETGEVKRLGRPRTA